MRLLVENQPGETRGAILSIAEDVSTCFCDKSSPRAETADFRGLISILARTPDFQVARPPPASHRSVTNKLDRLIRIKDQFRTWPRTGEQRSQTGFLRNVVRANQFVRQTLERKVTNQ